MRFGRWLFLLVPVMAILVLAVLPGFPSLPSLDGRVASHALTDVNDIQLAELARPGTLVPDHSGIRPLPDPLQAYAARVLLARAAEKSLDVQYYIWHDDITGNLLLEELWNAAERGVRVRLLLDDNGIGGLDAKLAALDSHANIEVRLYNPFVGRTLKPLGYLTDFRRLNHRMHNKSFTADASATIVGGRNIGDKYFGAGDAVMFADLDVLALGKAAVDVEHEFDVYWNCDSAYPASLILGASGVAAVPALNAAFDATHSSPEAARYATAILASLEKNAVPSWREHLTWAPATLVFDPPAKTHGAAANVVLLLPQLLEKIGEPEKSLDILSPYFVPGTDASEALADVARSGVKLRIVTNSLASNDTLAVHAGYARHRVALLRAGARLYEMRPDPAQVAAHESRLSGAALTGSRSSLHAKTSALDNERIFVGSFNLDQRSFNLNTEMGLVIRSAEFAGGVSETLDQELPREAYEVRLQENGDLEWIEQTAQGERRYRTEPGTGLLRRAGAGLVSLLPIEWML